MKERTKIILGGGLLFIMISCSIYFKITTDNALEKGQITIGITYDTYLLGDGGTLRCFFKTPQGIYTGTTSTLKLKSPRYYYKIKYSIDDPTICELYRDSLVADNIGAKIIKSDEITRFSVINGDIMPDWQWK